MLPDALKCSVAGSTSHLTFIAAHDPGDEVFASVQHHLQANGLRVATGPIVDATNIAALSSTKDKERARDPEMHQTSKANQWYVGVKAHIGMDSKSKLFIA